MNREDAIKKAQKLMAVAQDGRGNDNEAERALSQAEFLMRKFGIEQAEVVGSAAKADFDWTSDFAPYGVARQPAKSVPKWYQFISTGVATFTDTIVRLHYDRERGYGVGFYGERSDVMFAVWLITYLRDNVWKEVQKAKKDHPHWGKTDTEDFRKAMAIRLSTRMRVLRKERDEVFATSGTGTALVVVSDKLARRDAEFGGQQYDKSKVEARNHEAANAGRAAGDRVGFNRPVAGNQQYVAIAA